MRALTFQGTRTVRVETVPDPQILDPADAIVRVRLAGICGSDLHPYHGRERGLDAGTVMGHELVGDVVETGEAVRSLRRGQRVACPFSTSCGGCFYCAEGLTSRCVRGALLGWVERGHGLHGAQAELVRVPLADSTLVPVPEGVSDGAALLAGDVLSTGFHCADAAAPRPDGVAVVVGCGPVGLMSIVALRRLGPGAVLAVDSVPERLALAARFGATPLRLGEDDPVARVLERTDGRGADAVLEAVGSAEAGRLAYELVRPGGTISVAGVHTEPRMPFSPAEAYDRNLTLRVGRCPARAWMERVLPLLSREELEVEAILTHRLPLEQGDRGYRIFDGKLEGCVKVALLP